MGKPKKNKNEYNDFLDGEKLTDNANIRTSLQAPSSAQRRASPPPANSRKEKWKSENKGGKKPSLTHFLCLPLVTEGSRLQLENTLEQFQRDVDEQGIVPVKAVRPIGTLHLTLGVMSLDSETLENAGKALEDLDVQSMLSQTVSVSHETTEQLRKVHVKNELDIDLKSLLPMQSPHKTSILYAEPADSGNRLYPFAQALRNYFTEKGFLVPDDRPLKLHATILNTIYAKSGGHGKKRGKEEERGARERIARQVDELEKRPQLFDAEIDTSITAEEEKIIPKEPTSVSEGTTIAPPDPTNRETEAKERAEGHGPSAKSWLRFDAKELIEKYREFVWAKNVRVDRVQVCRMGAKKLLNEHGEVTGEEYEMVFEKRIG